jgi:WhiB family redox-sensing transcriptional regulator
MTSICLTGVPEVKTSQRERNLPVTTLCVKPTQSLSRSAGEPVSALHRGPRPATAVTNQYDTEEYEAMDWRHRALCRDEDPELFFPIGTTGPALVQIEQAKAVCRRCPAVEACLDWALSSGQDSGVWGGLSEDERRALKRRQARTRVRTA